MLKRPGYREAIKWLALNDDCNWVIDAEPRVSVAAALVRDLFDVTDARLYADLRKAWETAYPEDTTEDPYTDEYAELNRRDERD